MCLASLTGPGPGSKRRGGLRWAGQAAQVGGQAVPGEREEDVGRETRPSLRPAALHHSPHPAPARPAAELQGNLNKRCLETTADGEAGRCPPVVVRTDCGEETQENGSWRPGSSSLPCGSLRHFPGSAAQFSYL